VPPVIVQEDAGAHGSLWSASLSGLDTPAGSSNQTRRAAQISARLLAKCLHSKVFAPKFAPQTRRPSSSFADRNAESLCSQANTPLYFRTFSKDV